MKKGMITLVIICGMLTIALTAGATYFSGKHVRKFACIERKIDRQVNKLSRKLSNKISCPVKKASPDTNIVRMSGDTIETVIVGKGGLKSTSYTLIMENDTLRQLFVNGEKIPAERFADYQATIDYSTNTQKIVERELKKAKDELANIDFSGMEEDMEDAMKDLEDSDFRSLSRAIHMAVGQVNGIVIPSIPFALAPIDVPDLPDFPELPDLPCIPDFVPIPFDKDFDVDDRSDNEKTKKLEEKLKKLEEEELDE